MLFVQLRIFHNSKPYIDKQLNKIEYNATFASVRLLINITFNLSVSDYLRRIVFPSGASKRQ